MCGGYAGGRDWDNIQEAFLTDELYYQACKNIMSLPIPDKDPVTGDIIHQWHDAPVFRRWRLERLARWAGCLQLTFDFERAPHRAHSKG